MRYVIAIGNLPQLHNQSVPLDQPRPTLQNQSRGQTCEYCIEYDVSDIIPTCDTIYIAIDKVHISYAQFYISPWQPMHEPHTRRLHKEEIQILDKRDSNIR